jgi:hypothetical protein
MATVRMTATVGGLTVNPTITRSGYAELTHGPENLLAGVAGTLGTRTDDDTGVVTLPSGHGQTNGTYDVFWTGGVRRGMTGTVATNDLTLDSGAGDALPAQGTAVIVCKQTTINLDFVGNDVQMLVIHATQRAAVDLQDGSGTSHAAWDIPADEAVVWWPKPAANSASFFANPIAGDTVGAIVASSGSTTAASLRIGVAFDSTP